MMSMSDRLGWFVLGAVIGFVIGFIVRGFREMKVRKNENGAIKEQTILRISLFCVIVISVTAAFLSQRATNNVTKDQKQISRIVICDQKFLSLTIAALNQRTVYQKSQLDANVTLQRAQYVFFTTLLKPGVSDTVKLKSVRTYIAALNNFVNINVKTGVTQKQNPYPTEEQFIGCLNGKALPDVENADKARPSS